MNFSSNTLSPIRTSPNKPRTAGHLSPLPQTPESKRNYAFLSSAPESRQLASFAAPPSPKPLKLLSQRRSPSVRRPVSAQANDIRPATDWGFLMSGPVKGYQKHIVQRPWPEYVPESSAPVGRTWSTCARLPLPFTSHPSSRTHLLPLCQKLIAKSIMECCERRRAVQPPRGPPARPRFGLCTLTARSCCMRVYRTL